jgi:proteasome lid subunit RPN8/RPN11
MLTLDQDQYDTLVAHARGDYPNEACALLGGTVDGEGLDAKLTVTKVFPIPNAEPSPTYYVGDPKAQLKAMNEIDDRDEELVGIFHSHTFTEAYPSATDVGEARYPDAAYLIVSLADLDAPHLRGFRIVEGEVTEIDVTVTGAAG